MGAVRLAVVVPTRNRAKLAIRAVSSVLMQRAPHVELLVSDNSTSVAEVSKLQGAMADIGVRVIAPPTDLAMTAHWNWAIDQAQEQLAPTHITFLTDRMVFKHNVLPTLLHHISQLPTAVLSYNHDRVQDASRPIFLDLTPSSWRIYRISSQLFLDEVAAGTPWQWITPRMLNCVVPISVIDTLRSQTGMIFGSVSPDFYFGYRVAALVEDFYACDAPLLVHYALHRSNGYSLQTGNMSPDAYDFQRHTGNHNMESPFPTARTVSNAIFHEYAVVARETRSLKFSTLDPAIVAKVLRREADSMVSNDLREDVLQAISTHQSTANSKTLSVVKIKRFRRAITYRTRGIIRRISGVVNADSFPRFITRSATVVPYLGFNTIEAALQAASDTNKIRGRKAPPTGAIGGAIVSLTTTERASELPLRGNRRLLRLNSSIQAGRWVTRRWALRTDPGARTEYTRAGNTDPERQVASSEPES